MIQLWKGQVIFTENMAKLVLFIRSQGYWVRFDEFYRPEQMAKIYAAQGKGIKDSLHTLHDAGDLTIYTKDGVPLTKTEEYKFAGDYWESLDPLNRWGGRFSDGNHFSRKISQDDPRS